MKILVSGPTGFIGSALIPYLTSKGHTMCRLVRGQARFPGDVVWNPPTSGPDPKAIEGCDAVIHLAGESIAAGRWTPEQKKKIKESRVAGTQLLVDSLLQMKSRPKTLVCA